MRIKEDITFQKKLPKHILSLTVNRTEEKRIIIKNTEAVRQWQKARDAESKYRQV